MDSRLLGALRNAPSLNLYELSLALNQMLADPRRILELRRHLHLGAQVMYFVHRRRPLTPGRVLQLRATNATVQDIATHTHWKLPYATFVADPAQCRTGASRATAPCQRVRVQTRDKVSFIDKHLRERNGPITRYTRSDVRFH
jgi:hypothetical protein